MIYRYKYEMILKFFLIKIDNMLLGKKVLGKEGLEYYNFEFFCYY